MSLIAHQAKYDLLMYFRDPRARGFTMALPVLLLLLFGYIFRRESFSYAGTTVSGVTYYLSRMIVLDVVGSTLSNLVVNVVNKRETGALKRRRASPVRTSALIGGDVITSEVSALSITIVLVLIGWLVFGVHLSGAGAGLVLLTVIVGTACLCGVGYAVSTLVKSQESAGPLVMLIMFVLSAISGLYIPDTLFPAWLRDGAQVLPIRPLATAMQAALDPATNGGRQFAWQDLLIVLAWGAAGAWFAVRRFSWSPSKSLGAVPGRGYCPGRVTARDE
ncbi:MAG TPA: ABC transporter permease [Trebonia sp.]|nr:ABC transporter permease [Trebonia sp.]